MSSFKNNFIYCSSACILFLFSCKIVKQDNLYKGDNKEDAIRNVIYDFSNTEKNKINKVYRILDLNNKSDFYRFLIDDSVKINLDTITNYAVISKEYPSKYLEINNRLYIWYDSKKEVDDDIINVLQKYKVIDSTIYKIQKGILPESEWPLIMNAENIKVLSYYVCKKNVSLYMKKWSTHDYAIDEKLIKQCSDVK